MHASRPGWPRDRRCSACRHAPRSCLHQVNGQAVRSATPAHSPPAPPRTTLPKHARTHAGKPDSITARHVWRATQRASDSNGAWFQITSAASDTCLTLKKPDIFWVGLGSTAPFTPCEHASLSACTAVGCAVLLFAWYARATACCVCLLLTPPASARYMRRCHLRRAHCHLQLAQHVGPCNQQPAVAVQVTSCCHSLCRQRLLHVSHAPHPVALSL